LTNEDGILHAPPLQAVVADRVCNEVVIGQNQMKEMINAVVKNDIHIAQSLTGTGSFRVHDSCRLQAKNPSEDGRHKEVWS
jgi:hypothetical protein